MVKLQTIDVIRNAGTKKNKAFAYRVPIGDYNYLQCRKNEGTIVISTFKIDKIKVALKFDFYLLLGT